MSIVYLFVSVLLLYQSVIKMVSFHFGAFCFDVRQFGAFQFGAFHFDAVPVRRVSLWRSSTSARFTLARFHFGAFHFGAFPNFVRTYGDPVPANASSVSRGQCVCMFPFRVSQFFLSKLMHNRLFDHLFPFCACFLGRSVVYASFAAKPLY